MEDKARQDELIVYLEENNYDKAVIEQAKSDFEAGLSFNQVSIYKVRRLKEEERSVISKAMRLNMPQDFITDMVKHKYRLPQYVAVVNEFEEGTDLSVIRDVIKEFRFGHDIHETFRQIKERMANSKEKPPEPEMKDDKAKGTDSETADGEAKEEAEKKVEAESKGQSPVGQQETIQTSIGSKEFMDSVKMMIDTFSNTMQKQFDRMDKRDEEYRLKQDKETERLLNDRISELERELTDSKKDLTAASGVVNDKEQLIRSLQSDMDNKTKELSKKEDEIKKLREEMEQMKAGNRAKAGINQMADVSGDSAYSNPSSGRGGNAQDRDVVLASGNASQSGKQDVQRTNTNYTGNYTMNITMANGKQIPIQVERTERKSPLGISALMSKFLPKGPAKTLLTRMIEGRYSGEQLAEIVYAYDHKLTESEVKELLDANLPAEEMHGIINVVAAAKGGEE